ncbi:MAG TPA: hypothetical protein VGM13_03765 [Thermoanaerobaculia bacterium]|jgi:hypothetical protein
MAQTAGLRDRAEDDLRFIRDAMGRAAAFTCVPGKGGIAMGAVGLAAAAVAARASSTREWLAIWAGAGVLAFEIGVFALLHKAARADHRPAGTSARRFALALLPPLVAGAALTAALSAAGSYAILPAVWLLLYGCAVVGAGVQSVPVVPAFGLSLVAVGLLALVLPERGDVLLGLGFGVGHVLTGLVVARRFGG